MSSESHEQRQERIALRLGALLRDAATAELTDPVADPIEVVPTLPRGASALSEEDAAWLAEGETRLEGALRQKMPSEAVLSALAKARHDQRAEGRAGESNRTRLLLWVGAAAIAAGALLALGRLMADEPNGAALTFAVAGEAAPSRATGRIVAPNEGSTTIDFSDGSQLALERASSLRVRETDAHGAEVVIERGRVRSQVRHRDKTSWSVFAGPYEIQVVGTSFTTDWDPERQTLVVHLEEGSVRLVGGEIADHVILEQGQRFEASPEKHWQVVADEPALVEAPEPSQPSVDEPREDSPKEVAPAPSRPTPTWAELLANGKFDEIMNDARQSGISECVASCSIPRLRALADAARYTGDVATAQAALLSLRSRSPREAVRAGYLLGSLHEARGQAASALGWYTGYLSEAPSGSFAAEALAGKMRAEHALGRRAGAKASATEYLRKYPSGASAATARRILDKK